MIIAFHQPHEDLSHPKTILRELEIFCHARDIHKQLKSSTNWSQLDEKSIQRRITDFWLEPPRLMAARIMHVLGIKVLSNSQCRFLFKTKSKPEILESIISSFEIIDLMDISEWITNRQPPLVNVFNSLLSKLLGKKIGDDLTFYVDGISTTISEKSIDVRALFEFILCACMLRTPCVEFSYKKETATSVLLQLAGYLVLTKTPAEQNAVFRIALDLISIMKKENLLGIEDVGVIESFIGTNEYDLLRAYIEHRQKAITTLSSCPEDADRYQVLYLYSFIAEKVDHYTYQSDKPLANIPALTAGVKAWHKKIKTKIKETPDAKAKQSRNSLLNKLLLEAGKMLQLAQQYPTVVNDKLGTKSQFISGLLELINNRISHETGELKEGAQFSDILESETVKKYLMELHRIQKILFAGNPSFLDLVSPEIFKNFKASISGMQPMEIWTETCWFFFYCKSKEESVEFEQLALAWLSSTAPEELVRNDYLKLNCVLNYIEAHVKKDYEGGPISNLDLHDKFSDARKLVNQTAPKGSPINQRYVAQLSIQFIENGHPKVLEELSSCMFPLVVDEKSHVFNPPIPLSDFDDLNDSRGTNIFEEDDSSPLFSIKDEKEHSDAEQEKVLRASKLLFNYYRMCFDKEASGELSTFYKSITIFSGSSKKYLFNLVKLVFSQLGALEQSSVRWGQWKKLLHEMFEDVQFLMPSFTIALSSGQQDIKSLLISLSQYFGFSFENGRSFCQQILVDMLLALQKHRLNLSRKSNQGLRSEDIDQIKYVLDIAQIPNEKLTDADTWTEQLGLGAPEELEPLIVSFLFAEHLFKALGVSYSVVLNRFTEDEKQSNLSEQFRALVKEKFLAALGNRPFDQVVKFSQWAGKPDGLEILLTELLSLFLDENEENEKPLIENLVKSSTVSEGIYRRIITLLFTVFKDKADFTQKMMDYLSLDAAIKLQQQLRSNDSNEGSDFKKFGRAIQRRTLEAYYLWTNASSTIGHLADSEDPAPDLSILEYIRSLILHSERTHGLNSAFYGFYELFCRAYYTETGALALEQAENLIQLVDSAAGLLLGEDRFLSLREPFQEIYRIDDSVSEATVPEHIIVLNGQLKKLQGDNAVLSFEELINMVLSVAELDNYMQNRLQQLFLNTADYVQQRFLEKCMEAIETIDGDVRENIIFALLHTQHNELQRQFDLNDRDIYIFTERPLNLNSYRNCFLLIKSLHQLLFINHDGSVENLSLPNSKDLLPRGVATAEGLLAYGTGLDIAVSQMISQYNKLKFRSEILTMLSADVKTLTNEQKALLTRLAVLFDKILLTLHLAPNCPTWLNDLDWSIIKGKRSETLFRLTYSINFTDFITRIDEISKQYGPNIPRVYFNGKIGFDSGPSSFLQLSVWSCLLSYLNSREIFVIQSNPEDDKLHLITNPFKYRTLISELHRAVPVFHYSIFTGNERGLLPARREILDYRKNRPVQEIKESKRNDDSDNQYFSNTEDFLASPEAEIGLLKNLIEVINRQKKLESLEAEIKGVAGHNGNPVHPITLFKFLFDSILGFISDKDKIIKPLLEGIIKDITGLGRLTSPEEVAWYWSEYVFKPFIDQRQFCQVVFEKLLTWTLSYWQTGNNIGYIPVILELGVVAGIEPLQLLYIFESREDDNDPLAQSKQKLRETYPHLEFQIARQAATSRMRLDRPVDLVPLIQYFFEQEKLSAQQFFTEVYAVSHNARSVVANILSKLGFNTTERYISVNNVKSISQKLIEYLQGQNIVALDLTLPLIALLERLPQRTGADDDDYLAISCEDELTPDQDSVATALSQMYPNFFDRDTKGLGDETKQLPSEKLKRYAKEAPSAMAKCFEDYLYNQFKPNIEEKLLAPVNPAWKFALDKYSLLVELVEFFNKEILYGASSIVGDFEPIFGKLKEIFGVSIFDHPNLLHKLADKDQSEHEEIKKQYLTGLREISSASNQNLAYIITKPYKSMCECIEKAFTILVSELRGLFKTGGEIDQLLSSPSSSMLTTIEKGRIKKAYRKHDNGIFEIMDLPQNQAIQKLLSFCQQQMQKVETDKLGFYLAEMRLRPDLVKRDLQITYKKVQRPLLQKIKGVEEVDIMPREAIIPEDRSLRIRYVNHAKKYPEDAKKIFGLNTYQKLLNPESEDLIMENANSIPHPRRESFSARFIYENGEKKEDGNDDEKARFLTQGSPFLTQTGDEEQAANTEAKTNEILDGAEQILYKASAARNEAKEIREGGGIPKADSFDKPPQISLAYNSYRIISTPPRTPSPVNGEEQDDALNKAMGLGQGENESFGYGYD